MVLIIASSFSFSDGPQEPSVQLGTVSESELNFTWNSYQHCNNDSVLVMYEFELRRNDDNEIIYSGNESINMISFNNLESAMEYVFRVRVSITDYLTGSSSFSSWSSPTLGMMALLTTSVTTPPTTGMDHFELKVISMFIAYSANENR